MPSAAIDADTSFLTNALVNGLTTLVARIDRIGGVDRPTAQLLLLPDGRRLNAKISSRQLAAELAGDLYKTLSLEGEATWSTADWRLEEFKITAKGPYSSGIDVADALKQLAVIAGDAWDEIDPDEFISSLRSDSE